LGVREDAEVRQKTRRESRQKRINAEADEGQRLLWRSRYLQAVDGIRTIKLQLEERDNPTLYKTAIDDVLSMDVNEGDYKDAAEHTERVLDHLQKTLVVLTNTDVTESEVEAALMQLEQEPSVTLDVTDGDAEAALMYSEVMQPEEEFLPQDTTPLPLARTPTTQ
jgi:hypothetical protein